MLRSAYPYGIPKEVDETIEFLWGMVEIAKKLLMDRFLDFLKGRLTVMLRREQMESLTADREAKAMEAYVEATKQGSDWCDAVREWSSFTLRSNISRPHLDSILCRADERFVLALQRLHQLRRNIVVKGLMRVTFRDTINYAPAGDYIGMQINCPVAEDFLGGLSMVRELRPCDGTPDHQFHLCSEKWGAFLIAIASGYLPLNSEAISPTWGEVWNIEFAHVQYARPLTLREVVRNVGIMMPEEVDI